MARRILLADDSPTLHRVVRSVLERHGMQVTCADNGEEALRLILESPPDLVLADINMPRMGGLELCELMRREPHFRDIPVVFLVGPFDEYDDDTARRVGGNDHLIKPFDSFRLLSMVERYLPPEVEQVAVLETTGDFEPAEELGATATVEPIDDDALLQENGMPMVSDLADLPEPETLVRTTSGPDSQAWVAVELSESEQDLSEDSEELPETAHVVIENGDELMDGTRVVVAAEASEPMAGTSPDRAPVRDSRPDIPAMEDAADPAQAERAVPGSVSDTMDVIREDIRAHLAQRLEAIDIEQTVLEVIREEVTRILPQIVDAAVRERIQEIEREIERHEQRATDTGAGRD